MKDFVLNRETMAIFVSAIMAGSNMPDEIVHLLVSTVIKEYFPTAKDFQWVEDATTALQDHLDTLMKKGKEKTQ